MLRERTRVDFKVLKLPGSDYRRIVWMVDQIMAEEDVPTECDEALSNQTMPFNKDLHASNISAHLIATASYAVRPPPPPASTLNS